ALREARAALAREGLFHEYVQWLAAEQWAAARREATALGVRLMGDLAFVVSGDSADVWARQDEFVRDASLGAPPDVFDLGGQDWGLPVYRWEAMARNDHAWLRARVARAAALFAAVRLDHVVGFYRQFVIPSVGPRHFVPAEEAEQLALGERLLGVVRAAAGAAGVTGEDLGVVPDFVRRSLAALAIPGYRGLGPGRPAVSGRLRRARADQPAGHGRAAELGLSRAVDRRRSLRLRRRRTPGSPARPRRAARAGSRVKPIPAASAPRSGGPSARAGGVQVAQA